MGLKVCCHCGHENADLPVIDRSSRGDGRVLLYFHTECRVQFLVLCKVPKTGSNVR